MIINSTSFASITIDNSTYNHDVWVFADKTIRRRDRNHEFTLEEFNLLTKDNPEILLIGTGQYGVVNVGEEVIEAAKEKNIKLIYDKTPVAIKKFNKSKYKKIAAAFHTTC